MRERAGSQLDLLHVSFGMTRAGVGVAVRIGMPLVALSTGKATRYVTCLSTALSKMMSGFLVLSMREGSLKISAP